MQDFDQEKPDLEFKIGGETFVAKRVRPEVLAAWESDDPNADSATALKMLDERVVAFLENGDHERWTELRKREQDPVTMGQLNALLTWLLEASSDLPTMQPSPSDVGPGKTAASSKDASR